MFPKLKEKIITWLRLTRQTTVKVYDGYGDAQQMKIWGHVFSLSPLPRTRYSSNFLTNMFSLLRLFAVRSKARVLLRLDWNGEMHETRSQHDGFFEFAWKPVSEIISGWHPVQVHYVSDDPQRKILATGEATVFIPHIYQYACISDIDDTFLISHSTNLRKRLFVLLTENAWSRKPFEGVVRHYQLLSRAGTTSDIPNPFFYVSSSEWNLYDYIREFCRQNEMPHGVLLLNQIKRLKDFWKTGSGKHSGKYTRIVRILETFPLHKYILLGDDSQRDPEIYTEVVKDFKDLIATVYLRRIKKKNQEATLNFIKQIESYGVSCCYFVHSAEAIEHSLRSGLVNVEQ